MSGKGQRSGRFGRVNGGVMRCRFVQRGRASVDQYSPRRQAMLLGTRGPLQPAVRKVVPL